MAKVPGSLFRRILFWAHHAPSAAPALSADRLAQIARTAAPNAARASLRFDADPTAPVTVDQGRQGPVLLDAYSGTVIADPAAGYRQLFIAVENWHRWLAGSPQGSSMPAWMTCSPQPGQRYRTGSRLSLSSQAQTAAGRARGWILADRRRTRSTRLALSARAARKGKGNG
jgi:hypothetical protein